MLDKHEILVTSSQILSHNLAVEHSLADFLQRDDYCHVDAALTCLTDQREAIEMLDAAWIATLEDANHRLSVEQQDAFGKSYKKLVDVSHALSSLLNGLLEKGDESGDLAESTLLYTKHQNKYIQEIRNLIAEM